MTISWKGLVHLSRTFCVIALSSWGVACAGPEVTSGWLGSYIYYADQGQTAGGSAIGTEYTLDIGSERDDCSLTIQGYQVDQVILCALEYENQRADIQFSSYEGGALRNAYGVQVYSPGEILFSLEKGDAQPITTWHSLTPGEESAKKGVYFER